MKHDEIKMVPVNDDLGVILNSAVRYALDRHSYIVSSTIYYITPLLDSLTLRTLSCFEKDIAQKLNYDKVLSTNGTNSFESDSKLWEEFLNKIRNAIEKRTTE